MNEISLFNSTLNKTITYMKSQCEGIIDKELFIKIRETFPYEYKQASKFYNSSIVNDFIELTINTLNKNIKELDSKTINKESLANQYQSLVKSINDSYDNLNKDTIMKLIDNISDIDQQRLNLKLIIKGLILLQIIYSINNIVDTIIENNGTYNHLTEYKCANISINLEHITDNVTINDILISEENIFYNDEKVSNNIYKLFREADNDEIIEFTEGDLFEDDYEIDEEDNQSFSSENLNHYIHKLYFKCTYTLKDIFNKIIDHKDYFFTVNINLLMYLLIIILMHYILKF